MPTDAKSKEQASTRPARSSPEPERRGRKTPEAAKAPPDRTGEPRSEILLHVPRVGQSEDQC